ncbi:hypothetical protein PCCS19_48220 [Paenibacillus sp. CCS19]|uniref:hypothetical protein n=1 Tax=Paenibacillus sp. CCS19 TaxID=3158387 RepID=UPI00255F8AB4|nr:hypothetical protein [Paenibacillus cellulosilyticus]GMK41764.1 hypothetical protein PCCS19_48220 [Paenibacillus cellulosilyticus]
MSKRVKPVIDVDLDEERKPRTVLIVIVFSFVCGLCLSMFATIPGPIKYLFSLLALLVGIKMFGKLDRVGPRIWFVSLSIVWYLLLTIIIAFVQFARDNPLPANT